MLFKKKKPIYYLTVGQKCQHRVAQLFPLLRASHG